MINDQQQASNYTEQQTVFVPGSKQGLVQGDSTQIKIPDGIYDVDKSRILVTHVFVSANSSDAPAETYYRKDFFIGLQNQASVSKDSEQIAVYENLTACQCAYYHSIMEQQRTTNFLTIANGIQDRDIQFFALGGDGQTQITVSYPFKHFLPFIVVPTEKYLQIQENLTITLTLSDNDGTLINRLISNNTLAQYNSTEITFDASMCLLPDFQPPKLLQSNVQSHNIFSNSQQFDFKVKKGTLSEYQQLFFYDPEPTILTFGSITYANLKTDGQSQAKIKKNGMNVIDVKNSLQYNNAQGDEAVWDFILQLTQSNPKLGSTYAISTQKALFQNAGINFRIDFSETVLLR